MCRRIWNAGAGHARLPSKLVFVGASMKSSAAQLQRWLGRGHVQLSPLITIEASHLLYAYLQFFSSLRGYRRPVERLELWTSWPWRVGPLRSGIIPLEQSYSYPQPPGGYKYLGRDASSGFRSMLDPVYLLFGILQPALWLRGVGPAPPVG